MGSSSEYLHWAAVRAPLQCAGQPDSLGSAKLSGFAVAIAVRLPMRGEIRCASEAYEVAVAYTSNTLEQ